VILKLLKFIPTPSLPVIAVTAFLAGSSVAAYTSHVFHKAALSDELTEALNRQNKAVLQAIEENDEIRALDQKYFNIELAKAKEIQVVTKFITKEIVKYVPDESTGACNYTIGAVGLLNVARQPFNGSVASVYETTDQPNPALQATSAHTQRSEIEWHAQCAGQYNELAAKHDALVDWLNENNND